MAERRCEECGSLIPNGATTCPNCGCPVEQQAEETTAQNMPNLQQDDSYKTVSGKAVVTSTNPSESEITIAFDNLNMSKDSNTYSFNGTVTLPFSYDGWYD